MSRSASEAALNTSREAVLEAMEGELDMAYLALRIRNANRQAQNSTANYLSAINGVGQSIALNIPVGGPDGLTLTNMNSALMEISSSDTAGDWTAGNFVGSFNEYINLAIADQRLDLEELGSVEPEYKPAIVSESIKAEAKPQEKDNAADDKPVDDNTNPVFGVLAGVAGVLAAQRLRQQQAARQKKQDNAAFEMMEANQSGESFARELFALTGAEASPANFKADNAVNSVIPTNGRLNTRPNTRSAANLRTQIAATLTDNLTSNHAAHKAQTLTPSVPEPQTTATTPVAATPSAVTATTSPTKAKPPRISSPTLPDM